MRECHWHWTTLVAQFLFASNPRRFWSFWCVAKQPVPWGSTVFFFQVENPKTTTQKVSYSSTGWKKSTTQEDMFQTWFWIPEWIASHWIFITHQDCFSMHFCRALPWIIGFQDQADPIHQAESQLLSTTLQWGNLSFSDDLNSEPTNWTFVQTNRGREVIRVKLWGENLWLGDLATLKYLAIFLHPPNVWGNDEINDPIWRVYMFQMGWLKCSTICAFEHMLIEWMSAVFGWKFEAPDRAGKRTGPLNVRLRTSTCVPWRRSKCRCGVPTCNWCFAMEPSGKANIPTWTPSSSVGGNGSCPVVRGTRTLWRWWENTNSGSRRLGPGPASSAGR